MDLELRIVAKINELLAEYYRSLSFGDHTWFMSYALTMRTLVALLPDDSLFKQGLNTDVENALSKY